MTMKRKIVHALMAVAIALTLTGAVTASVNVASARPANAAGCHFQVAYTTDVHYTEWNTGRRVWQTSGRFYGTPSGCRDVNATGDSYNWWHQRPMCGNYRLRWYYDDHVTAWQWVCADRHWIVLDRKLIGYSFVVETTPDPMVVTVAF
jgi:hypothetical protein